MNTSFIKLVLIFFFFPTFLQAWTYTIASGAGWKGVGVNPGIGWALPTYDDSAWLPAESPNSQTGPFGCFSGAAPMWDISANTDSWMRHTFTIPSGHVITSAYYMISVDDDYELLLNGTTLALNNDNHADALPATASISAALFNTGADNTISIYSRNVGGFARVCFSLTVNASPVLPLHLDNFSLKTSSEGIKLSWQLDSEAQKVKTLSLEHKSESEADFSVLETFNAKIEEQVFYHRPEDGVHQYRLKVEDFDGNTSYSSIQEANLKLAGLFLYPNPVLLGQHLSVRSSYRGQIKIFSLDGEQVFNEYVAQKELLVNTEDLKVGMYLLLNISENGETIAQKILIQ